MDDHTMLRRSEAGRGNRVGDLLKEPIEQPARASADADDKERLVTVFLDLDE